MELVRATTNRVMPFRRESRASARRPFVVRGRISWKDQRGTTRIANVVTRNVSDEAVYVELREASAIPIYRLVQFQVSPEARRDVGLPESLRTGKVLSAVLRVGERRTGTGTPEGYALRMLVDPVRKASELMDEEDQELVSATAIA
jgi:hypothetical protein